MNFVRKISNVLERIKFILFGFLFFAISSISLPANSINYEQDCCSYSPLNSRIAEERISSTSPNVKLAINVIQFSRLDYANCMSSARNAAKGSTQFIKSSLSFGREMLKEYKLAEHASGPGRFKEFTDVKGINPGFVDFGTRRFASKSLSILESSK